MALGSALDYSTVIYLYKMKDVQLVQHVQCQFIGNFVFQSEDEEFVDDEFVDDEDVELFPDMICKPYMFEPELKRDDSSNVSASECLPNRLADTAW